MKKLSKETWNKVLIIAPIVLFFIYAWYCLILAVTPEPHLIQYLLSAIGAYAYYAFWIANLWYRKKRKGYLNNKDSSCLPIA